MEREKDIETLLLAQLLLATRCEEGIEVVRKW